MAPPINVQDWYGDRHTCQIASGALESFIERISPEPQTDRKEKRTKEDKNTKAKFRGGTINNFEIINNNKG